MTDRQFIRREDLTEFVRAAFGSSRRLVDIDRLTGGTKKGVYRLTLDDGATSVLYAWNDDENYWPTTDGSPADPFAEASGADLLVAAHARLTAAGVRVPEMLIFDGSRAHYPADLALLEDIRGGTLQALIERSPDAAEAPLRQLGEILVAMQRHQSSRIGKVALVESGIAPQDRRPEQVALDAALRHLGIVAGRVEQLGTAAGRIEERVRELADAVHPRDSYGLIHGELGADHVMLDDDGAPVMIDIEGVMFFDVEWEHAFTQMRLGPEYARLQIGLDLDPARLKFYDLAQSLSLVEGPLRIADGDFPDREWMLWLAGVHTEKVLRLTS